MESGSSHRNRRTKRGAIALWITSNPVRIARNLNNRMSMAALAQASGVSCKTIGSCERGDHIPSLATVRRIASALDKNVFKLLEEIELWTAMRP